MKEKSWQTGILVVFLVCQLSLLSVSASADSAAALWPQQAAVTNSSGKLVLDSSGASDGYFFAAVSYPTSHRLKLRVIKDGTTLTYDLNTDGSYELFPLQLGNVYYEVHL